MFFSWARECVRILQSENAWLRERLLAAEQKAAIAQAELVRLRTDGLANVAPRPLLPPREPVFSPPDLDALAKNPEWAEAGT